MSHSRIRLSLCLLMTFIMSFYLLIYILTLPKKIGIKENGL